jgi:hypothetical protein
MHEKTCDYKPGDEVTFDFDSGPTKDHALVKVPATVLDVRHDYVKIQPKGYGLSVHWCPASDLTKALI